MEDGTFSVSSQYRVEEDKLRTGSFTHGDHVIGAVVYSIHVRSSSNAEADSSALTHGLALGSRFVEALSLC